MNLTRLSQTIVASIVIATLVAACGTTKKGSATAASPAPSPANATPASTTGSFLFKPSNGIYEPGNEELAAINAKYNDVTLDKLKEGYILYAESACISCHKAYNIYTRGEEQWKPIIDNMAKKARISDEQKDAVYKYVLAIKATQPKTAR